MHVVVAILPWQKQNWDAILSRILGGPLECGDGLNEHGWGRHAREVRGRLIEWPCLK